MRTVLATILFVTTAVTVGARPDDVTVWRWPAEKSVKDGAVKWEVEYLVGEHDIPDWEIEFRLTEYATGTPYRGPNDRLAGVKATDDTGAAIPFTRFPQAPRALSFTARPGAKAKAVVVHLAPVEGRPDMRVEITAGRVRGLTAKTSYYLKATK